MTFTYTNNNLSLAQNYYYKYNEQVQQIITYINENITESITIESLANKFYISNSYICRIFKAATGTTVNKYICTRRISIAKTMLAEWLKC